MINDHFKPFQGEEHQSFALEKGSAAVLLVHGFPGTPAEMRPLADALFHAGWTAHGLLLPGFGADMATLPQRSHDDWLNAVCQAVLALKAAHAPVLLAGNSLGGALALWAAAQLEHRGTPVDGLMLFAPFWRIDHLLWHMLPVIKRAFPTIKPFKLVKPDFSKQETRDGVRNFMPDVNLDDPAVRAAITEFELPIGMFNEIRHAGEQAYRSLHHVHAPALVLQGTHDNLVRPAATRRLLVRLRGRVQYVEVPAAHDLTTLKSPAFAQVERAVLDFAGTFWQDKPGA